MKMAEHSTLSNATGRVVVATLLGEAGVPLAVQCIVSWLRCLPLDELIIYEDGTLTGPSRQQLAGLDPRIKIISAREADQRFKEIFDRTRYPLLAKIRDHFPLGRKIVDIPLFSEDWINFIDSDVYFYRPVKVMWTQQTEHKKFWMMKDFQNLYSARTWQLLPGLGISLPRQANSGLISCQKQCYDLGFLEFTLRRCFKDENSWNWVIEQTLWAALGWRCGLEFYDPNVIGLATSENRSRSMVALHWAGLFRSHFVPLAGDEVFWHESADFISVESMSFEPASLLTWSYAAARRIEFEIGHNCRRLRTLLHAGRQGDGS